MSWALGGHLVLAFILACLILAALSILLEGFLLSNGDV